MISLHVYLTPKSGREIDLDKAVREDWLPAMAGQPGFICAAVVKPFPDVELDEETQVPQMRKYFWPNFFL